MPWDRYISIGIGIIGIQPSEFWNMSLKELLLAIDGFTEFNTTKKDKPLSKDELNKLMELYPD